MCANLLQVTQLTESFHIVDPDIVQLETTTKRGGHIEDGWAGADESEKQGEVDL